MIDKIIEMISQYNCGNYTIEQAADEILLLSEQEIKELKEKLQKSCTHFGTTIAHGPDADKCTNCELTWNV